MNLQQIADQRLANQSLLTPLKNPKQVVATLGAIQSQDFWGACWAISQRCSETQSKIISNFNSGKILRTHILRPTWHFVPPKDIRWIQELTGPRVLATTKSYFKKLDLHEETLQKANLALAAALKSNKALTRAQVKQVYQAAKIDIAGLKLGFLIIFAELTALICSGPLQGKQHTYMLVSDRAPQADSLDKQESLAKLTKAFFSSHGPATAKDFSWWSSLTMADVRQGIELADLQNFEFDGEVFHFTKQVNSVYKKPLVHLLPNYDENLVAYKYRKIGTAEDLDRAPSYEDLSFNIVTSNGKVVGGWKKQIVRNELNVKLNMFKKLTAAEQNSLDQAVIDLQKFSGLKVNLI